MTRYHVDACGLVTRTTDGADDGDFVFSSLGGEVTFGSAEEAVFWASRLAAAIRNDKKHLEVKP